MEENKQDLVSIIIPVYNASKFLNDTLNTILNQTYTNFEALFVNDCSSDNSADIILNCSDKRIKLINNEINSGAAISRNNGMKAAKGRYICFLDADDLWDNNKLEKQVEFMKNKECAFSYHSYIFADERGNPTNKKVIAKDLLTYKQALKNNIISTITVMFDINKIEKNLIKMPNLKYIEDTATWWKILRNGYNAYGIPDLYAYYRRSGTTQSSNKVRTLKKLWNVYIKEEKLNYFYAFYCFCLKNINAIRRRIK